MNTNKRFLLETFGTDKFTLGKLYLEYPDIKEKLFIAYSIEKPWLNNNRNISCIPSGHYVIKPTNSPKFGLTYYVESITGDVVGLNRGERTHILFHKANKESDVKGCIGLGLSVGCLDGKTAVLNSGKALRKFISELEGYDYRLDIVRR